jgi:hypothetical protein
MTCRVDDHCPASHAGAVIGLMDGVVWVFQTPQCIRGELTTLAA